MSDACIHYPACAYMGCKGDDDCVYAKPPRTKPETYTRETLPTREQWREWFASDVFSVAELDALYATALAGLEDRERLDWLESRLHDPRVVQLLGNPPQGLRRSFQWSVHLMGVGWVSWADGSVRDGIDAAMQYAPRAIERARVGAARSGLAPTVHAQKRCMRDGCERDADEGGVFCSNACAEKDGSGG